MGTIFSMSEHKHGLFNVMPQSMTKSDKGGLLVMRLLTNNADSNKAYEAALDLIAELPKIPANTRLDVTVGKPLADKTTESGCDEADTVLQYKVSIKQLERRARAIIELRESDIAPEVVKSPTKTGGRKMVGGLASGLAK